MPDFVGTLKTPRLAAAPSAPVVGQMYYNTTDNKLYYWNGTTWVASSGGSSTIPPRLDGVTNAAPPGNDCNNAWDAGWYTCQPAINAPGGGWGSLLVCPWGGQTATAYQMQLFLTLGNNNVYYRTCYGTFSAWIQIYPIDEAGLPSRLKAYSQSSIISDPNTVMSNGWYYCGGTTNTPGPNEWYILVAGYGPPGYLHQMAFSQQRDEIWDRRCMAGTWYPWNEVYPSGSFDLVYKGNFAAGNFKDGDIVVSGGITWMCVRPTSAVPSGWSINQGVPQPVVNGQWVKGAGGAAVWSPIIETDVRGLVVADTAWHNVGAAAEPAYQNGWNTYGSEWGGARFRKLSNGMVAVNGLIQGGTIGQPAFYLPVGYRPIGQSELCSTDSGNVHSRVDFGTDGRCTPLTGVNGYFSVHANFYVG